MFASDGWEPERTSSKMDVPGIDPVRHIHDKIGCLVLRRRFMGDIYYGCPTLLWPVKRRGNIRIFNSYFIGNVLIYFLPGGQTHFRWCVAGYARFGSTYNSANLCRMLKISTCRSTPFSSDRE